LHINNRKLRQILEARFSVGELKTLCQDLAIDYENIPGETKADRARELVSYYERRGDIDPLRAAIRASRPDIEIDDDRAEFIKATASALCHPYIFSRVVTRKPLRSYQLEPAQAILDSILHGRGATFAVMMSRQAGKNELSAQLEAYLLNLFQLKGGQIVKASPTFKPQTENSIIRLCERLQNKWNGRRYQKRMGYMVELGKARALFFSAGLQSNVVGATASILLEADEAQDIAPAKWYKDFLPMGASTNVTRVLWGTAWTSNTLLATRIQQLEQLQAKDGIQRVFRYNADTVGAEVPAYATYVAGEVARLGRQHPLIRSQYYLEEIDAEGGMFPRARRALMRGGHQRQCEPEAGKRYALLVDVAGEDEEPGDPLQRTMLQNPRRDATALTVVEVDTEFGRLPHYRVVDRRLWLGTKHTALHAQILALARHWGAVWVVVDATGVGAGLASFLAKALGEKNLPVVFSPKVKSELGWSFLGVVETGRYQEYQEDEQPETRQFWYEVETCQYQVRDGPGKLMSWGVWETPAYDGLIAYGHDDLLISASLCAILDKQDWPGVGPSAVIERADELEEIDQGEW
jgi:hypothetical protein